MTCESIICEQGSLHQLNINRGGIGVGSVVIPRRVRFLLCFHGVVWRKYFQILYIGICDSPVYQSMLHNEMGIGYYLVTRDVSGIPVISHF